MLSDRRDGVQRRHWPFDQPDVAFLDHAAGIVADRAGVGDAHMILEHHFLLGAGKLLSLHFRVRVRLGGRCNRPADAQHLALGAAAEPLDQVEAGEGAELVERLVEADAILTFTSSWFATSRLSCLRLHPMRRSTSMLRVSPSVFSPSR